MSKVPAALEDCSTTERIAALLYLGWTHEEIAAATNVSKGTVQNRRRQLEGGKLQPPPEVFDLVRAREREIHRWARNSQLSPDALGAEMADRMSAIADLDVVDIGPDGEISYEELVAFAVLIAGQVGEFNPQEVVKRLAPVAILIDYPTGLSESLVDSSRQPRAESPELHEDVTEINLLTDDDSTQIKPSADNFPENPTTSSKDNIDEPSRFSQKLEHHDHEQQFERHQTDNQAAQISGSPSRNKESIHYSIDLEECWRRGGTYDEELGACWLPSKFGR